MQRKSIRKEIQGRVPNGLMFDARKDRVKEKVEGSTSQFEEARKYDCSYIPRQ